MEITPEVKDAHRHLSQTHTKFIEYICSTPGGLVRENYNNVLKDERFFYLKFHPWPFFINRTRAKEIKDVSVGVSNLIKSIPGRLFGFDHRKISKYYQIPEPVAQWSLYGVDQEDIDRLLARGDFIFSPGGAIKCLEFNMQANLGGWERDELEETYINMPHIAGFLSTHNPKIERSRLLPELLEHLVENALDRFQGPEHTELNLAIVFPDDVPEELRYYKVWGVNNILGDRFDQCLQKVDGTRKGRVLSCFAGQLKTRDHWLTLEGKKIHLCIEFCNGMLPLPVLDALKHNNLLLYNGPVTRLMSSKLNLALLSEHQGSELFSEKERELIKAHIPWTRKVAPGTVTYQNETVDLESMILSNREGLVLKSADGIGGYEVFVGRHSPEEKWREHLALALEKKDWVVQEYVESHQYIGQYGEASYAPHRGVWGIFVFGSRYASGHARIQPTQNDRGVINVKQGAELCSFIEVDEP